MTAWRVILMVIPCFVTAVWLWGIFLLPEAWNDRHGYTQVNWAVLASIAHLIVGATLLIASAFRQVRTGYGAVVFASPIKSIAASAASHTRLIHKT